jgi:hypothetical protein
VQIKETLQQGNFQQKIKDYELREDGILMYRGRVYVPKSQDLKNMVLREIKKCALCWAPRIPKNNCNSQESIFLGMYENKGG